MLFFRKNDDVKKDLIYVIEEEGRAPHVFELFDSAMLHYRKRLEYLCYKKYSPEQMYYLNVYVTTKRDFVEFFDIGSFESFMAMNLLVDVHQYFVYDNCYEKYVFIGDDYLKLYQKDYTRAKEQLKKYQLI